MADDNIICIVDDDSAVRDSLETLLSIEGYLPQAFGDATSFLNETGNSSVQCVILDVRLPDADGIEVLNKLNMRGFQAPIIVITGHGDVAMAVKAMRLGAIDFIEKPFDPDALVASVREAVGEFQKQKDASNLAGDARSRMSRLSPREHEVMLRLVGGQPNKVIAFELGLSPRTIEIHRARVMEKTETKSLSHLVRLAIAAGVTPVL